MANESPASVLVDQSGSIVGVIYDGAVYRIQTESVLASGSAVIGKVGIDSAETGGLALEATLALIKAKTDNIDVALSTRAVTGLTDAELRAVAVPVSGPLTDAELRATAVPISASVLPLPIGAATEATLLTVLSDSTFTNRINTLGQKAMTGSMPVVIASDQSTVNVSEQHDDLVTTGSINAAGQDITTQIISGRSGCAIQIAGSWLGVLRVCASVDGVNYADVDLRDTVIVKRVEEIESNGIFRLTVSGFKYLRVTSTTWVSGIATIVIRQSVGTSAVLNFEEQSPLKIGDGVNSADIVQDGSKELAVRDEEQLAVLRLVLVELKLLNKMMNHGSEADYEAEDV